MDKTFDTARIEDYDALVLPGGAVNADSIRLDNRAQARVKATAQANKPITVIGHGAWLLICADLVKGKTLTSWPSLADDLKNAGANWIDQAVGVDGTLISSRKPDAIPAFNAKLMEALAA